ncbi:MAG: 3'-5' exonuclease [Caldiserica bacterium]|nr:3'-5' exonuclease [Caldisericota bacterium]
MTNDERTQWEVVAQALEETGDYRVVRKLRPVERYAKPDGEPTQLGVILDTETTGLDPQVDDVIELGMILFEYAPATGRIGRVVDTFDALRDPGRHIPAEITAMTHITDDMVRGRAIDAAAVEAFVARATVIIAHNAAFDRPFVEKQWSVFAAKPWGCSMSQVHWRDEGIATQKQELIALCMGFFYDAHRAENDCRALLHILASTLPVSGQPVLKPLLDHAMANDARIWAIAAPFDAKEALKVRGYRWSTGAGSDPKAWHVTVMADELEAELVFLDGIYGGDARTVVRVDLMSPLNRFSTRT